MLKNAIASYNRQPSLEAIDRHGRTIAYYQHTIVLAMVRIGEIDDCVNLSGSINNAVEANFLDTPHAAKLQTPTDSAPLDAYDG